VGFVPLFQEQIPLFLLTFPVPLYILIQACDGVERVFFVPSFFVMKLFDIDEEYLKLGVRLQTELALRPGIKRKENDYESLYQC